MSNRRSRRQVRRLRLDTPWLRQPEVHNRRRATLKRLTSATLWDAYRGWIREMSAYQDAFNSITLATTRARLAMEDLSASLNRQAEQAAEDARAKVAEAFPPVDPNNPLVLTDNLMWRIWAGETLDESGNPTAANFLLPPIDTTGAAPHTYTYYEDPTPSTPALATDQDAPA